MTSEIVVMNCNGVALAADSAATITRGRDDKVFKSADKLFMLSERHPVGVMVYNNGSLLGVPWETIIKLFRRFLGVEELPTIEDYGKRLIDYLTDNADLFPAQIQESCYFRLVEDRFAALFQNIRSQLVHELTEGGADEAFEPESFAADCIVAERDRWDAQDDIACFPANHAQNFAGRFSGEINDIIRRAFGSLEIKAPAQLALTQLASFYISKAEIPSETRSGVVIAGFGEREHFPVMQAFELGEVYAGKLKVMLTAPVKIDQTNPSCVEPFADAEMANTFLGGINAGFQVRVLAEVAEVMVGLTDTTIDAIEELNATKKQYWKDLVHPARAAAIAALWDKLEQYRQETLLEPVHAAVRNLPKDELAHVAASLVNLNLLKKRMSLEPETVGGPVDVAVISKGDGFVWIERKHYFRPELNPHFISRYHRASPHAENHPRDPTPPIPKRKPRPAAAGGRGG